MNGLIRNVGEKYINGGFPLLIMGILWLGLWLFAWYPEYLADPRWGHNYAISMAFLAVGLAYFNRRFLSDLLALLSTITLVLAALELLPVNVSAITNAALIALIVLDIGIERKRVNDLFVPSAPQTAGWLKKYVPLFAYIMLASLALIYFLIRMPAGTWETDMDTVVFDALLLPYVVLLIIERLTNARNIWPKMLAFCWGMLIMIIILIMLTDQPETWPVLVFVIIVTVLGIIDIFIAGSHKRYQTD